MSAIALALLLAAPAVHAQSAPPVPASVVSPVGAALMAPGLRVTDLDRSLKFYATALGLMPGITLHHGTLTEVMLFADSKAGRMTLILLRDGAPGNAPRIALGNGFDKVLLRVPNLTGVVTRMTAAGYPVGAIRRTKQGPSVLTITDPDGYTFELVGKGA